MCRSSLADAARAPACLDARRVTLIREGILPFGLLFDSSVKFAPYIFQARKAGRSNAVNSPCPRKNRRETHGEDGGLGRRRNEFRSHLRSAQTAGDGGRFRAERSRPGRRGARSRRRFPDRAVQESRRARHHRDSVQRRLGRHGAWRARHGDRARATGARRSIACRQRHGERRLRTDTRALRRRRIGQKVPARHHRRSENLRHRRHRAECRLGHQRIHHAATAGGSMARRLSSPMAGPTSVRF
jgi:hypothetical protein